MMFRFLRAVIDWIEAKTFSPASLRCGGECFVEVVKRGSTVGKLWYRMPTSDEILSYAWDEQNSLMTKSNLRKIESEGNKTKKMHEILINEFFLPYSKKIFLRAEGRFFDENNVPIGGTSDEQFEAIKKTHSHLLVGVCETAYRNEFMVKKK